MARHGFGQGEYRYFSYPLPPLIQQLRASLYERLWPLANRWRTAIGTDEPFPAAHRPISGEVPRRRSAAPDAADPALWAGRL